MKKKLIKYIDFTETLNNQELNNKFHEFKDNSKAEAYRVTIEPVADKRSINQNSFLHLVLKSLSDCTGYTPAETKELMREKHLKEPIKQGAKKLYEHTFKLSGLKCKMVTNKPWDQVEKKLLKDSRLELEKWDNPLCRLKSTTELTIQEMNVLIMELKTLLESLGGHIATKDWEEYMEVYGNNV